MIIDFRNLTKEQSKRFNELTSVVIDDYNTISSQILKRNNGKFLYLICNQTSRNVFHSELLQNLHCLKFISEQNEDEIEKIICSDRYLYITLKKRFKNRVCLQDEVKKACKIKKWYQSFFWCLCAFGSKSAKRQKKILSLSRIILIDTFVEKKSIKAKKYDETYYLGLDDLAETNHNIVYLINYIEYPRFKEVSEINRNSKENLLFDFDFLRFSDYIYALLAPFLMNTITTSSYEYCGFNLKYLLKECESANYGLYFIHAALNYRFWKRLKKRGIDIELVIDWFENQSYDKSTYYSLNKYFPSVPIHSYVGFIGDAHLNPHIVPTSIEYSLHIAPSHLYMCSEALARVYKKIYPIAQYELAPFFRSANVGVLKKIPNNNVITILIPLTTSSKDIKIRLQLVVAMDSFLKGNFRFLIKPHPSHNIDSIKKIVDGTSQRVDIVYGDISVFLQRTDILVATLSTVVFEAMAMGIPIINVLNDSYCNIHKPESIDNTLWIDIPDMSLLPMAIEQILSRSIEYYISFGKNIEELYFNKVNKTSVSKLLETINYDFNSKKK